MTLIRSALVIPWVKYKFAVMALLLTTLPMPTQAVVPVKIGTPAQNDNLTSPAGSYDYTPTLQLEPRVPPTSYKSAVKKGREMWAMIEDPLKTKQSTWAATDVSKWGWSVKFDKNIEVFKDKTSGLEAALAALQVSPETSSTIRLEHNKDVTINGVEYPATNAEYCGIYNPAKGVIIASDRHSPNYRKATSSHLSNSKSPLPLLQHWSDLTFLSYQLLASTQSSSSPLPPPSSSPSPSSSNSSSSTPPHPLQYIFIRGITNRATQQIILAALQHDGYFQSPNLPDTTVKTKTNTKTILPWPHFWTFTPHNPNHINNNNSANSANKKNNRKKGGSSSTSSPLSDPFLAILGTENFAGVAPLLAQHHVSLLLPPPPPSSPSSSPSSSSSLGFGEEKRRRSINSIRIWGEGGNSQILHGMVEVGWE